MRYTFAVSTGFSVVGNIVHALWKAQFRWGDRRSLRENLFDCFTAVGKVAGKAAESLLGVTEREDDEDADEDLGPGNAEVEEDGCNSAGEVVGGLA